MKQGDLVKSIKHENTIGIVMEIFDDLNEGDPWIRVLFTYPSKTYQWVKQSGLIVITEDNKKEGRNDPS